jgi:hypothetical protein
MGTTMRDWNRRFDTWARERRESHPWWYAVLWSTAMGLMVGLVWGLLETFSPFAAPLNPLFTTLAWALATFLSKGQFNTRRKAQARVIVRRGG